MILLLFVIIIVLVLYPTAALQCVYVMIAFLHSANACLSYDGIADLAGIFVGNTLGALVEFFVVDLVGAL